MAHCGHVTTDSDTPVPAVIRAITPDDWREWRDLRLEALREAPHAFSATVSDWESAPEERWRQRLSGTHARGRGVGDALVRAVLGWAGHRIVTLQVAETNTAPTALYRRHGFEGTGRLWTFLSAGPPR